MPEFGRASSHDAHEHTVERIRDVTRGGKVVLEGGGGVDTAFRQLFPTTYDLVVEHPEGEETGEDKEPRVRLS
ncbi:hypothetical protein [Nonomuraea sp. NPDC052265]|uniref:hypothetical protein n=1 Tax=Nonomuraea sp. NPDC052265 TaxID=3364374 RepID=UPI0037CC9A5C